MKLIAVSQRIDYYPERRERRDALDQKLVDLLKNAGYLALPVPNTLLTIKDDCVADTSMLDIWLEKLHPKGVLLSGGNDIGICRDRDITETYLLEFAYKNKLPLLGICRGMQMMGVWSGSKLKKVENHVAVRHKIYGEITGEVNSFHNFSLSGCPQDYVVLAHSANGDIEAIKHKTLVWEGWMWHPEREQEFSTQDIQRIKRIYNEG